MRQILPLSILATALLAAGCPDCGTPPIETTDAGARADAGSPTDGGAEELGTLVVAPDAQTAFVGETMAFTAFLERDNSQPENVTGDVSWSLDGDDAFELKAPGTVLVLGEGAAALTATLAGQSASADVTGRAPSVGVESLTVDPAVLFLPVGVSERVRAQALYADGQARDVTELATWEALTPAVATVDLGDPAAPRVTGVTEGFATIRVAFGGQTLDLDVEVVAGVLVDIEIVPAAPALPVGGVLDLVAIGRYADGELFELTDTLTWSSADTAVLTVDSVGRVTGVAAGATTVTALDDTSGVQTSLTVTVTAAQIVSLEVSPAVLTVPAGARIDVRATAVLSDAAVIDVTSEATWSIDDEDVAFLEFPGGGSGGFGPLRVLGVFPATTTLTASYAGVDRTVTVTVTDAVLDSVELIPGESSLPVGTNQDFFLVGTFSDGQRTNLTADATWTSGAPDVAFVSQQPAGRVTGVSPGGPVLITASVGAFSVSADVTVTDALLVTLQINPPIVTLPIGEDAQLNAIGVYSDNSQRIINFDVTWSSADEAIAQVSNALGQKGRVTGVGAGETLVTAQVDGLTDTATLRVTDAQVSQVIVAPPFLVLNPGHIEQAQAFATYDNGSTLNITAQAVWSTGDEGVVQVSNSPASRGRVTGIAAGMTQLSATFGGVTGSSPAFVTEQGFEQLVIGPRDVFLAPGLSAQLGLFGQYAQNNDVWENLTAYAVWESSDPAIATVDNFPVSPGVVTALAPGIVTISASYQGTTITRDLVVEAVTIESLELSPPDPNLPVDAVQQFVALATFDDGSAADVTSTTAFSSDDNTRVTMLEFFPGVALALAPGVAQITGTIGGMAASTTVTVTDAVPQLIVLSPINPIADGFEQLQFYATAVYDDDSTGDLTLLCSWSSDDTDVVLVLDEPFAKGIGFAIATGSATVTADCGPGLSDTTLVTVR